MFSNWKGKLAAIGGFIGFVLTVLPFFEIYAKDVLQAMTAHYIWGVGALVSLAVFVWGVVQWRNTSRVTIRNVQDKIKQWLDTFKIQHAPYDFEHWHFTRTLTYGIPMFIGRPKIYAGRYIIIQADIKGVLPEDRVAFEALTGEQMFQFYGHLALETARARISFSSNDDLSAVSIRKQLPITDQLSESDIIESLNEIYQSAVIIWNTTALRLSKNPRLTQPTKSESPALASGPTGPTGDGPVITSGNNPAAPKGSTGP